MAGKYVFLRINNLSEELSFSEENDQLLKDMTKNIVLIGFMGVGKGQVGRTLAQATSMYAVDCDDLIESYTNMRVKKIFSELGEDEFRKLERKTAKWLEKNVQKSVISTGGGFVKVPNLKKIGRVVHLHGDFDYIIEKILSHPNADKKIKKRPLLKDLKSARKLFDERLPIYSQVADKQIKVHDKSPDEIAGEIMRAFKLK